LSEDAAGELGQVAWILDAYLGTVERAAVGASGATSNRELYLQTVDVPIERSTPCTTPGSGVR